MDFHLLIKKISKQLNNELPFVVYSASHQSTVTALLQKDNELYSISEFNTNGFVLAPFVYDNSACFISENNSEKLQSELIESEIDLAAVEVNEEV